MVGRKFVSFSQKCASPGCPALPPWRPCRIGCDPTWVARLHGWHAQKGRQWCPACTQATNYYSVDAQRARSYCCQECIISAGAAAAPACPPPPPPPPPPSSPPPARAPVGGSASWETSLPQPQPASASARLSLPQPQPASASVVMSPAETELSPAEVEDEDSDPPTPSEAGGQVSNEAEDEISRQAQELNKEMRVHWDEV